MHHPSRTRMLTYAHHAVLAACAALLRTNGTWLLEIALTCMAHVDRIQTDQTTMQSKHVSPASTPTHTCLALTPAGCLPGYSSPKGYSIGIGAPILLSVLRIIHGLALGGDRVQHSAGLCL